MTTHVVDSPVGPLRLESDGTSLTAVRFDTGGTSGTGPPTTPPDEVLLETVTELRAYFAGDRTTFDLPLRPVGTSFQLRVWAALLEIPYGRTWSYGRLAAQVGDARASRAVGLANGRNPLSIVVPCHRVIGADGSLTGYGGGVPRKRWLLEHEAAVSGGEPTLFASAAPMG